MFGWLLSWFRRQPAQPKKNTLIANAQTAKDNVKKTVGDAGDPVDDTYPSDTILDDNAIFDDAIRQYQEHVKKMSEFYRKKYDEWQKLAADIGSTLDNDHQRRAHEHNQSLLETIGASFVAAGKFLVDLHRLAEPASVNFNHIINDIHRDLLATHGKFQNKVNDLEAASHSPYEEQQFLKFQVATLGVAIWNELIKLENNINALIDECLAFQKTEEKITDVAIAIVKNLVISFLMASLGNFEELKNVQINNVCWEEFYRNYLNNALDNGKNRVNLMEIDLAGELARAQRLINEVKLLEENKTAPASPRPDNLVFFQKAVKDPQPVTPVVEAKTAPALK